MPDEVTDGAESEDWRDGPRLIMTGPICRAAPTRIAHPGRRSARSRRWLIVGAIAVAALLGGASAALTSGGTSPAHPAHAVARQNHSKPAVAVAAATDRDETTR
jgi:hypothetical protein